MPKIRTSTPLPMIKFSKPRIMPVRDNHGKGFRSDFEKASNYIFEGTTIKVLDRRSGDGSVLYEMELYPGECLIPGQKSDMEENEEIREDGCEIKQEGMSMTL